VLLISTTLADVSQLMQAVFTAGLLLIAGVAAGVAWAQLKAGRQAEKLHRVYGLVDRTTHLEFVALTSDALAPFPFADNEAMKRWWHDPDNELARRSLVTLLNFFEEMAGEYLDGLLDLRIADRGIAYVAASVWQTVADFVAWFSDDTGETRAWDRLREFAEGWQLPDAV
jgi:hypothetical protein